MLPLALWSFLMKRTITTACNTIAVTITTPNTPPRGAANADESLLMHESDLDRERKRLIRYTVKPHVRDTLNKGHNTK